MIYKILIAILTLNVCLFSQQAEIFKTPTENLTLPAVINDVNGTPKNNSMSSIESKWVQSSSPAAETLLQTYSSDAGVKQIIKNVLASANIPEGKINSIKISFSTTGTEERSIDKESAVFKEDFTMKYPAENMLLITKLYRTKTAVITLTEEGAADMDPAVKDAISGGLRYGNKSESVQGNKMIIEVGNLVYGYEYTPLVVEKTVERLETFPLFVVTELSFNSISSVTITEGAPDDFYVKVTSALLPQPVEFRMSPSNTTASFRVGTREGYTFTFKEKNGSKITVSISGFKISLP
jgi:hypothetical protein